MISSHPLRSLACLGLVPIVFCLASAGSLAAAKPKVDLEEAKAELAKAKAQKAAGVELESPEEAVGEAAPSESPTRRKLRFSFRKGSDRSAPAPQSEEEKQPVTAPQVSSAAKQEPLALAPDQAAATVEPSRPKLFRLFAPKPAKQDIDPAPIGDVGTSEAEPTREAIDDENPPPVRPKFSLFRKRPTTTEPADTTDLELATDGSRAGEKATVAPDAQPGSETADGVAASSPPEKKRLFGALFEKKTSPESLGIAAATSEETAAEEAGADLAQADADATTKDEKAPFGTSLFGFLRRDNTQDYAKAEKTKLGNSLESDAATVSADAVAKEKRSSAELGWYVITEPKTPFYAIGPGQPLPPEKTLDRGSMLTVTKGGWGWSNVKLESGQLGVVASKSMRPATVAEISRHDRTGATASNSAGSRRLFNILGRGPAPQPELPSGSDSGPIRNFGLLPSIDPNE